MFEDTLATESLSFLLWIVGIFAVLGIGYLVWLILPRFRIFKRITNYLKDLGSAFVNWDMQLYDFWEQIVYMLKLTMKGVKMIIKMFQYIVTEITSYIRELMKSLRGWG